MNEELVALKERWPLAGIIQAPEKAEILVIGAYKGLTMAWLAKEFPGFKRMLGFEPQEWAVREARETFHSLQLESLWLINYALGDESRGNMSKLPLQEFGTDACSFVNQVSTRQPGEGLITEAAQVLPLFYPEGANIDLCILNAEGAEFELIPHFYRTGWLNRINRFAIQWHPDISPNFTKEEMDKQISLLEESGFTTKVDERPVWSYHIR